MLSYFANPHRFMKLSDWLAPICYVVAALACGWALYEGLYGLPPEKYMGDSVRILVLHVPFAWLSLATYAAMAGASFVWYIWRHELADMAAKSMAPLGAAFTAICLITGSIWGRYAWDTWWEWDGRMTSTLIMLFLYLGYMALRAAMETRQQAARAGAILAMMGAIILPVIKYSVDEFASLHQTASVKLSGESGLPSEYLIPILIAALGVTFLMVALTLTGMRAEVYARRAEALTARRLAGAPAQ